MVFAVSSGTFRSQQNTTLDLTSTKMFTYDINYKYLADDKVTWLVNHDANEVSLCQFCIQPLFECLRACWNHFLNLFVVLVSSYYVGSICFMMLNQWAESVYHEPLTKQLISIICDAQLWNPPSLQCCSSLKWNIVTLSRPLLHPQLLYVKLTHQTETNIK